MEIPGYEIQREIGKGGMATVYLATQESLHRSVVLKVLDSAKRSSVKDLTERFLDEGRIVASLKHPNIVTIYDIGLAGDEMYISMEYIEGGDLKERLESHILPDDVLDYLVKIGSALNEAHKKGVIHRDVKPANILFRDENTPLLTDFGIAKNVENDKDLTSTGIFLGSPNYVSPEQAEGAHLDGRADIYSLGCIFYEMLTGYKPYHSDSVIDIVIQHKTSPVPTLPDSLKEYQPLLNRMMAKKREERFQDAASLIEYIQDFRSKHKKRATGADFDVTGYGGVGFVKPERKRMMQVLISLLVLMAGIYGALQYIDISIKSDSGKIKNVPTKTVVQISTPTITAPSSSVATTEIEKTPAPLNTVENVSDEVKHALLWLGKQSLEEYKLTYPPKDNAYYYFSRLLEIDPGDSRARSGILSIAERYAILAETELANNNFDKTRSYIEIGLRINPENTTLQTLKELVSSTQERSFLETIKSYF
jgi:serine/threonine-protein kinase PpkA